MVRARNALPVDDDRLADIDLDAKDTAAITALDLAAAELVQTPPRLGPDLRQFFLPPQVGDNRDLAFFYADRDTKPFRSWICESSRRFD
jgi:hypothetical protein